MFGDYSQASEADLHIAPPPSPHYSYAMAKRMIDVQIEAYGRQYKKNYMSLIPTNIFGENDNYNLINGHVIPSLIKRFDNILSKLSNCAQPIAACKLVSL